ncbi:MAG: hypothetical protein Tsb0020_13180 [Haliangiales bacterium]
MGAPPQLIDVIVRHSGEILLQVPLNDLDGLPMERGGAEQPREQAELDTSSAIERARVIDRDRDSVV